MRKFSCLLIFCTILIVSGLAQNKDIEWLRTINIERNKDLDNELKFITNISPHLSWMSPVCMLSTGLIKHDRELTQKGYVAGASILLSTVLTTSLKYTINRKRPSITFPEIQNVTGIGSPSFPSGHTSSAFATATSLSLAFPKWYVIAPSYLFAGAVAYSRMHLGAHYPSDVLAGMLLGTASSFLCYKAQKWIK